MIKARVFDQRLLAKKSSGSSGSAKRRIVSAWFDPHRLTEKHFYMVAHAVLQVDEAIALRRRAAAACPQRCQAVAADQANAH